jgi:hypothetical protein
LSSTRGPLVTFTAPGARAAATIAHDVLTHAASHRRWADVDLAPERPTLHVRQGRVAVTGGSVVDEPKSQRSRRDMPLPA